MRITSLSTRGLHDGTAYVWLARSRALFAAGGSGTGLALTMLLDLYRLLGDQGAGPSALAMLDAIEACVDDSEQPFSRTFTLSLIAEKRSFVLTEAAMRGTEGASLGAARAEYERALTLMPQDERRRFKIHAALVTVDLMAGAIDRLEALARLEDALREARQVDHAASDMAPILTENIRRLRRGDETLAPYEPI
jgi:hypothetical protein